MLSNIASNTTGQENHRFINRSNLLQGSVDYYIDDNKGYIVSSDVEYNEYIYYGSEEFNTTWAGDPWIENVWNRDKKEELKEYKNNINEALHGYLT